MWARRLGRAAGERMPTSGDNRSTLSRARRLTSGLTLDAPARFARYMSCLDRPEREGLYTDEYSALISESRPERVIRDAWADTSGDDLLDIMLETDINTWLPGDLIPKMDIATMAHGLEARSPFLDHELMQLAASIPGDLKLPGTRKKGLLRDALRPWLPDEILDRPKQGFCVPMAHWLRTDLRGYSRDILLDPVARGRGYFHEAAVSDMLDRHARGVEDHANVIWALLVHELWHRDFIDGSPSTDAPRVLATV